jgi:hypothetical protein
VVCETCIPSFDLKNFLIASFEHFWQINLDLDPDSANSLDADPNSGKCLDADPDSVNPDPKHRSRGRIPHPIETFLKDMRNNKNVILTIALPA